MLDIVVLFVFEASKRTYPARQRLTWDSWSGSKLQILNGFLLMDMPLYCCKHILLLHLLTACVILCLICFSGVYLSRDFMRLSHCFSITLHLTKCFLLKCTYWSLKREHCRKSRCAWWWRIVKTVSFISQDKLVCREELTGSKRGNDILAPSGLDLQFGNRILFEQNCQNIGNTHI